MARMPKVLATITVLNAKLEKLHKEREQADKLIEAFEIVLKIGTKEGWILDDSNPAALPPRLNVGEVLEKLRGLVREGHSAREVVFDFANLSPVELCSYRGYYDHLALNWKAVSTKVTVSHLIHKIEDALSPGRTFEGWKGGNYTMHSGTPLWVANSGEPSFNVIYDLVVEEPLDEYAKVVILTRREQDWL